MGVTSQPIAAADALALGLLDALIEGDLREGAVDFAEGVVAKDELHPRTGDRADKLGTPEANAPLYEAARALARTLRPHQPAPLKAIEAIELATRLPFAQGCAGETELFLEVVRTEPAKALIHLFFAERAAGKVAGIPKDAKGTPIRRVGIIGAGTIGGGLAMACTNAGFEVILQDSSRGALDLAGFDRTDIIIEAVEDMSLKQQVFREIVRVAHPGAVLATNTSTLDIDALAASTSRGEDVIGLHFLSPADVVRLLEIARGTRTSASTLATTLSFAKALGKVGVVVANSPGFIGNRMMLAYRSETQYMVEEGATPEQIDAALTSFGMAMVAPPDPEVTALIRTKAREPRLPRRSFTNDQIVERAIFALINEGARALELGLVERASDIDIIHVLGYGFPAWRGGPMFYADRLGLDNIHARLQSFQGELGDRWTPAPLLERLVCVGGTFRGLDRR
jgi:3-hydroxyacyl-CoA dehydrogenase